MEEENLVGTYVLYMLVLDERFGLSSLLIEVSHARTYERTIQRYMAHICTYDVWATYGWFNDCNTVACLRKTARED